MYLPHSRVKMKVYDKFSYKLVFEELTEKKNIKYINYYNIQSKINFKLQRMSNI